MFGVLGSISLISILGGLFAQDALGSELASVFVIGGAILGSINVLLKIASWFKK